MFEDSIQQVPGDGLCGYRACFRAISSDPALKVVHDKLKD